MIRQPTSTAALYAYHAAALRGERPPAYEGEPQCGWYRMRMVKNGPWVPVVIWMDQDVDADTGDLASPELMLCEVGGERRSPAGTWMRCAGKPITEDEFHRLTGDREDSPTMQATHAPVDLTERAVRP